MISPMLDPAMLRVMFLNASLTRTAGGVSEVARSLSKALLEKNIRLQLQNVGIKDQYWRQDGPLWDGINTSAFQSQFFKSFGYSSAMDCFVKHQTREVDVLHQHGLWLYSSIITYRRRMKLGLAYVISPHGMLEAWAVNNSSWKKRIASIFYERKLF